MVCEPEADELVVPDVAVLPPEEEELPELPEPDPPEPLPIELPSGL